ELLGIAAARELPRIALDDALRICLVLRDGDPDRYERAAVRWLGRFALEARDVMIEDLRLAAEALDALRDRTAEAMERLRDCASRTAWGELAVRVGASELCERDRALRAPVGQIGAPFVANSIVPVVVELAIAFGDCDRPSCRR